MQSINSFIAKLDPHYQSRESDRQLRAQIENERLTLGYEQLRIQEQNNRNLVQFKRQELEQRERHYEAQINQQRLNNETSVTIENLRLDWEREKQGRIEELRGLELKASIYIEEIKARNNIELAHINSRNKIQEINAQASADLHLSTSRLVTNSTQAVINMREDLGKQINNAVAQTITMTLQAHLTGVTESIKEPFRESERRFELEKLRLQNEFAMQMAILNQGHDINMHQRRSVSEIQAKLIDMNIHQANFTHDEILKLAIRIAYPEKPFDFPDLEKRFDAWYSGLNI